MSGKKCGQISLVPPVTFGMLADVNASHANPNKYIFILSERINPTYLLNEGASGFLVYACTFLGYLFPENIDRQLGM